MQTYNGIFETKYKSLAIVIPMYNEVDSVPLLAYKLKAVQKIMDGLIDTLWVIVDDGSTDMTLQEMRAHFQMDDKVLFIRHWKNQGFGIALKTGVEAALERDAELIITIDADTNYDHLYIPYFVDQFTDECDIMTASPWHPEGEAKNFPWYRLILSKGLSFLYRHVLAKYGQPLFCYSACFRIAKAGVYRQIKWQGRDFLATSEIMVRCIINGLKVRELPFKVNPRWFGESKMKKYRQIKRHLNFIRQIRRDPDQFRVDAEKAGDMTWNVADNGAEKSRSPLLSTV